MSAPVVELITEALALGITLRLQGDRIQAILPNDLRAKKCLERLKSSRDEVIQHLREQKDETGLPPGFRILRWEPKPAPVEIVRHAVVIDVDKFIAATLKQLRAAADKDIWAAGNWTIRELLERLEQVGLHLERCQMPGMENEPSEQ